MLSQSLVREIDRLLREGKMTQLAIGRKLGVSRGTVNAIANGRRRLHGRESDAGNSNEEAIDRLPERCTRCGHTVELPCRICRSRAARERERELDAGRMSSGGQAIRRVGARCGGAGDMTDSRSAA